jgi:hypothetical protein
MFINAAPNAKNFRSLLHLTFLPVCFIPALLPLTFTFPLLSSWFAPVFFLVCSWFIPALSLFVPALSQPANPAQKPDFSDTLDLSAASTLTLELAEWTKEEME